MQLISFCKDTPGLDNPEACFEHIFNSLPKDSVGVEGFTPESNYAYAVETLEIAWDSGISPEDWAERYAGFQEQCPGGYYPDNVCIPNPNKQCDEVIRPQGVCWNAWRYVLGWGYDTQTVIGNTRWNTVGPALYRSGVLPEGTQHYNRHTCSVDGEVAFTSTTPGNFRQAGTVYTVKPVYRLANVMVLVLIGAVTIVASYSGDNQQRFFRLGVAGIVVLSGLWLFETAISDNHIDTCEIRVGGLFGAYGGSRAVAANQVWWGQTFDRFVVGSVGVGFAQFLLWALNPWYYNTGEMP